jgi:hypothetical protein
MVHQLRNQNQQDYYKDTNEFTVFNKDFFSSKRPVFF